MRVCGLKNIWSINRVVRVLSQTDPRRVALLALLVQQHDHQHLHLAVMIVLHVPIDLVTNALVLPVRNLCRFGQRYERWSPALRWYRRVPREDSMSIRYMPARDRHRHEQMPTGLRRLWKYYRLVDKIVFTLRIANRQIHRIFGDTTSRVLWWFPTEMCTFNTFRNLDCRRRTRIAAKQYLIIEDEKFTQASTSWMQSLPTMVLDHMR